MTDTMPRNIFDNMTPDKTKKAKHSYTESERKQIEETKRFLSRTFPLRLEIKAKSEQIRALSELRYDFGGHLSQDGVKSNRAGDKLAEATAKFLDFEDSLAKDITKLLYLSSEIKQTIELLPLSDGRTILSLRYESMKPFAGISDLTMFDIRWVRRLHDAALLDLSKILDNLKP